jgi:hypothetical protein
LAQIFEHIKLFEHVYVIVQLKEIFKKDIHKRTFSSFSRSN